MFNKEAFGQLDRNVTMASHFSEQALTGREFVRSGVRVHLLK